MSMAESSLSADAWARKIEREVLRRLASVGQANVAMQLGVSESMVSRWKDGDISRFCKFLALLGLKATPQAYRCMDEEMINALIVMANRNMRHLRSADQLVMDPHPLEDDE